MRLARRAVVDKPDEYGNTLLHLAALNGSREIFRSLVNQTTIFT
jgi:ankyrin repeat protein